MDIIKQIGVPALLEQLAEECAELAQAALKLARYLRGENAPAKSRMQLIGDLLEEIADVDNILVLIACTEFYDGPSIGRIRKNKMARWVRRIKAGRQQAETNPLEKCYTCKHVYQRVSDADTLYCRCRKGCKYEEFKPKRGNRNLERHEN